MTMSPSKGRPTLLAIFPFSLDGTPVTMIYDIKTTSQDLKQHNYTKMRYAIILLEAKSNPLPMSTSLFIFYFFSLSISPRSCSNFSTMRCCSERGGRGNNASKISSLEIPGMMLLAFFSSSLTVRIRKIRT